MHVKLIEKEDDFKVLIEDIIRHLPESVQLLNTVKLSLLQDGINRKIYVPSIMSTSSLAVMALEPSKNSLETEGYWSMFCARPEGLDNLRFLISHLVDWKKDQQFGGVHSDHIKLLEEGSGKTNEQWKYAQCHIYSPWSESLTPRFKFSSFKESSSTPSNPIPDNHLIKPVEPSTASLISSTLKFQDESSLTMISKLISSGRLYGIHSSSEETESPLGWMALYGQGSLGLLYISHEERGKGLGSALAHYMVQFAANYGIVPFVYIEDDNTKSIGLFQRLCFGKMEEASFLSHTAIPKSD